MNKLIDLKESSNLKMNLLVSAFTNGVTKSGSNYLNITLADNSKSLLCKYWDVPTDVMKEIKVGKVYSVNFDIINYNNTLQGKIFSITSIDQNLINIYDYIKQSAIDEKVLKTNIKTYINDIENPIISKIIVEIFKEYHEEFFQYPAATKNHHEYFAGLATHTLTMLDLAKSICSIYPNVSKDLLFGGVILHDIGKIDELSGPIMTEYTTEGRLIGHISIMHAKLFEIANKLGYQDSEEVMLLRHMVLSHHGKLEFGSPVLPMTLEAELLNLIDNIDSRVESVKKAFAETNESEFSARIFSLENRAFYKHKF